MAGGEPAGRQHPQGYAILGHYIGFELVCHWLLDRWQVGFIATWPTLEVLDFVGGEDV